LLRLSDAFTAIRGPLTTSGIRDRWEPSRERRRL
jgi:hypothetical protein